MKLIELKTWIAPFSAVWDGSKTHELRRNDRDFEVGDMLVLREWDHDRVAYTGRVAVCSVTYLTRGGAFDLPFELCVMSVRLLSREEGGVVLSTPSSVDEWFSSRPARERKNILCELHEHRSKVTFSSRELFEGLIRRLDEADTRQKEKEAQA